jgi:hypothetical protein
VTSTLSSSLTSETLRHELREAVSRCLKERGLDNPDALSRALGVTPGVARSLLGRKEWTLEEATRIVERLNLPIRVEVTGP